MSKLDQVVFIIENGEIIESSIRNLDGYIDTTTTPYGVAPRFHVRGNELWTWGHQGNFPKMVRTFENEAEAQEALEDTFAQDFWTSPEFSVFPTHEAAEKFLRDNSEDDMNEAQLEAIANADAHTSNAGLPSYSQLLKALESTIDTTRRGPEQVIGFDHNGQRQKDFAMGWNAAKEQVWASLEVARAVVAKVKGHEQE